MEILIKVGHYMMYVEGDPHGYMVLHNSLETFRNNIVKELKNRAGVVELIVDHVSQGYITVKIINEQTVDYKGYRQLTDITFLNYHKDKSIKTRPIMNGMKEQEI